MIRYVINGIRGLLEIYKKYGHWGIYLKYKKEVLSGPFKGMKYRNALSFYSQNYPKIIGCYEEALHPFLYDSFNKKYDKIINLGAGQGYYAVGFALSSPTIQVEAWDTDAQVLKYLEENARLNAVADQVQIFHGAYQKEDLAQSNADKNDKVLIFCDIEGDERYLFTAINVRELKNVDVLIEIHEFVHADIETYLSKIFMGTHQISIYEENDYDTPVSAFIKSKAFNRKLFNLVDEKRPTLMKWMLFEYQY
ncbi:MAG: methyltransferase [Bacteroidota bacterium]